jgi:hypothetical protein
LDFRRQLGIAKSPDELGTFLLLTFGPQTGRRMKALSNVFTQKFFLYFIFSMLYYYRKVGKIMAFIVGCFVGLLVGVLGSVVAKAIKESNF